MFSYLIPMVRKDGRGVKLYRRVEAADEAEAMDLAEDQVNSSNTPEGERYVALTWEELPDAG